MLKKVILELQMAVDEMQTKQDALKMELYEVKAEKNARWEKWEVGIEVQEERHKVIEEFVIADRQKGPGSAELEKEKNKNKQAVVMYKAQCELVDLERASWCRQTADWAITRMEWKKEKMEMNAQLNKQNKG